MPKVKGGGGGLLYTGDLRVFGMGAAWCDGLLQRDGSP